jgi:hypothetical protein
MRPHRSLVVWMFSIKPPKERLQSELACPATHDDARHEAQRALVVVWKSKLGELPHVDKQNKLCVSWLSKLLVLRTAGMWQIAVACRDR